MFKKITMAIGAFTAGICAFAQESGGAVLDTTAVDGLLNGLKENLTQWVTSAVPLLGSIAGGFLIFWLGKVIFRVVKGWSNKAS